MDLRPVELFDQFTDDELKKFIPIIKTIDLKAGRMLFNEGDPGDALYIIYNGSIRVFKMIDAEAGEEKSLALLTAGTYLGEMTLLEGSARSASARAETDSIVLKITRDDFVNLLHEYPQAAIRLFISFMHVLSERLRRTNEELVVLFEIGRIVSSAPPVNQLFDGIIRTLANTVKVDLGAVFILNEITGKLEIRQAVGEGSIELLDKKMKAGEGIVGKALQARKTVLINDLDNSTEYSGVERFGYERPRMLVAPLVRTDRPFGAILLARGREGKPFDNANVNLVNGVASQASAAIEAALFQQDSCAREEFCRKNIQF